MKDNVMETIDLELAILIRRAVSAALDNKLGTLDRSAYLLLRQLSEKGAAGVKALADEFRLDVSTVSRQTASLEAKGYVQRIADPDDGRASFFEVTPFGMETLTMTKKARVNHFTLLLKDWSEEERRTFSELLSKLNRTFIE